jgi:hypothetical protein
VGVKTRRKKPWTQRFSCGTDSTPKPTVRTAALSFGSNTSKNLVRKGTASLGLPYPAGAGADGESHPPATQGSGSRYLRRHGMQLWTAQNADPYSNSCNLLIYRKYKDSSPSCCVVFLLAGLAPRQACSLFLDRCLQFLPVPRLLAFPSLTASLIYRGPPQNTASRARARTRTRSLFFPRPTVTRNQPAVPLLNVIEVFSELRHHGRRQEDRRHGAHLRRRREQGG